MHEIRHFKASLYALVLLGLAGYGIAAQMPALWLCGTVTVLLHLWLSSRGKPRPLNRLLANLITIGGMLYGVHEWMGENTSPVLVVGEFLAIVQIVKLWEAPTHRNYVQVLVIGLLLMVSAAISTASLGFCMVLALWLLVALYCCLLFHLKVDIDRSRLVMGIAPEKYTDDALSADAGQLSRAARRLVLVATIVGGCFAVAVFFLFPRVGGPGMFGNFQFRSTNALVGFSDDVNFQNVAKLQANDEPVAYVSVSHDGQPVSGSGTLLLRGNTLDRYTGQLASPTRRYRWIRSGSPRPDDPLWYDNVERRVNGPAPVSILPRRGRQREVEPPDASSGENFWEEKITLRPIGSNTVFSISGAQRMRVTNHSMRVRYYISDGVIETVERPIDSLDYEIVATNQLPEANPRLLAKMDEVKARIAKIDPQILQFAMRPQVSGVDAGVPLARQRESRLEKGADGAVLPVSNLDEKIAVNIAQYLRTNYTYDLDLTDTRRIEGRDPLVAFLYDFKRGHCEYFAGAMTLLCQSLGMQARMVVGFACDPDSFVNGYYVVKQSHAHAWVEVLTAENGHLVWKTFDPTSGSGTARRASLWERTRTFWDYLDFSYAKAVVAFDNKNQSRIVARLKQWGSLLYGRLVKSFEPVQRQGLRQWLASWLANADNANLFWTISRRVFLVLMVFCLFGSLLWFSIERVRLRRRAARIGIISLPSAERIRLAKQLGFYDDLLKLLDAKQIVRQSNQTPMEFSRSLLFLPSSCYDTIVRLTELFYRIRYGDSIVTPARRRHLATVLSDLETSFKSI